MEVSLHDVEEADVRVTVVNTELVIVKIREAEKLTNSLTLFFNNLKDVETFAKTILVQVTEGRESLKDYLTQ